MSSTGQPFVVTVVILFLHAMPIGGAVPYISQQQRQQHQQQQYETPQQQQDECTKLDGGERSLLLWSVESPRQRLKSFLFGTIHVSYDEVWGYVSQRVKEAFAEAETIVFELELQNAETVEQLLQCKNLDGDETVRDRLPAVLYDRLKQYMSRFKYKLLQWVYRTQQLPKAQAKREAKRLYLSIAGDWEMKRPVWLLFLLYQMSESSSTTDATRASETDDYMAPGGGDTGGTPMLDAFLARKAQELGKELRSIESPLEQCNPLHSVNEGQLVFALNYTLAYLEWIEAADANAARLRDNNNNNGASLSRRRNGLAELVSHYRCGSLEASVFNARRFAQAGFALTPELDAQARHIDELLVDDIILKRNLRMASRADALIRQSPFTSFFFAIGAGHFLGEKSLIKALEKYDYKISAVTENDDIIGYFRSNNASSSLRAQSRFNELWVRDEIDDDASSTRSDNEKSIQPDRAAIILPSRVDLIPKKQHKSIHRHRHSQQTYGAVNDLSSVYGIAYNSAHNLPLAYDRADFERNLEVTVELVEMPVDRSSAIGTANYDTSTATRRGAIRLAAILIFHMIFTHILIHNPIYYLLNGRA